MEVHIQYVYMYTCRHKCDSETKLMQKRKIKSFLIHNNDALGMGIMSEEGSIPSVSNINRYICTSNIKICPVFAPTVYRVNAEWFTCMGKSQLYGGVASCVPVLQISKRGGFIKLCSRNVCPTDQR
jgi:hypothetical protein